MPLGGILRERNIDSGCSQLWCADGILSIKALVLILAYCKRKMETFEFLAAWRNNLIKEIELKFGEFGPKLSSYWTL